MKAGNPRPGNGAVDVKDLKGGHASRLVATGQQLLRNNGQQAGRELCADLFLLFIRKGVDNAVDLVKRAVVMGLVKLPTNE